MTSTPKTPTSPATPRTPGTPKTPGFNTKSPTIKRILQESRELSFSPDPSLTATPLETNLFEWHFTITGPPSSPYEQGAYHGRIVLPTTYPLRPPSFRFLTPSGRFEVNREICLSISGHHEETWQPAWGIRTALCAIRAFMASDAKGQIGGIDMNDESRRSLAKQSRSWKCMGCGARTNGEIMTECEAEWRQSQEQDPTAKRPDMAIPEELRLAYKDDINRGPPTPTVNADAGVSSSNKSEHPSGVLSPVARAGPVANVLARSKPPPSPLRATSLASEEQEFPASSRTHPVLDREVPHTVTAPTPSRLSTMERDTMATSTSGRAVRNSTHSSTGVPKWVDIAIVMLAVAIVYFAIGKFLA